MALTTLPTPYFQGFRHLKSKLAVCNFLLSPNAFFFFSFSSFFFFCFSAPFPFLSYLLYVSVLKWPWNLEFGSPPSTLSCHLSLKNEYEEKYTATSVRGSKKVLKEDEVGDEGRSRPSLRWF